MFLLYIFFGILAGILSGMFGVGGGIILIPLFIHVLSYNMHQAVSLSLISMSFPVFIISLMKHYKAQHWTLDMLKWGGLVAVGMLVGSLIGAVISSKVSTIVLKRGFAFLLIFVAVKLWLDKK